MKQRLTVTVDAEVLPAARRYARARGVSLSSLVEQSLRALTAGEPAVAREPDAAGEGEDGGPSFAERWGGAFAPAGRRAAANGDYDDAGYEAYRARKRGPAKLQPAVPNEGATTWAGQWRGVLKGKLPPPTGDDPRYEYLARKYDLF